jgi:hypothetical protein
MLCSKGLKSPSPRPTGLLEVSLHAEEAIDREGRARIFEGFAASDGKDANMRITVAIFTNEGL